MTDHERIIIIAVVAIATAMTRFLPFLVFGEKRNTPPALSYLGRVLPPAIFAMLVVYSLKSAGPLVWPFGLAELIGVAVVVLLHLAFRRMLVSVGIGTLAYILLVNTIFI